MTGAIRSFARHRQRGVAVLVPIFGVCLFGACALVLLALGTGAVGAGALGVGAVSALIPVVPVAAVFLWADRWEPEPASLLLAAFAWGACVAALTALVVNDTAVMAAGTLLGAGRGTVVGALVSAPLVEEAVKGVFVLGVWRLLRSEFDGVIDGVVYAGITATGFAFTENIYYFGTAFSDAGLGALGLHGGGMLAVFVLRGVLTPFLHPLFTAMTGIGIGMAATLRGRSAKVTALIAGYLLAACLHALWNTAAVTEGGRGMVNFYLLVIVPLLVGVALFVRWQRTLEQRVIVAGLPWMVERGWIAPSEVALLTSLRGRRAWRRAVRRESGAPAARAVRRYQSAVSSLAFLQDRMASGVAGYAANDRTRQLVAQLVSARADAVLHVAR